VEFVSQINDIRVIKYLFIQTSHVNVHFHFGVKIDKIMILKKMT